LLTEALDPARNQRPVSTHHQGNFVEAVKRNDPRHAVASLKDAVRSNVISHLCDIAVRSGERVTWHPPQEDRIGGRLRARSMLRRSMRAPWTS